jgi:hypothetical protein
MQTGALPLKINAHSGVSGSSFVRMNDCFLSAIESPCGSGSWLLRVIHSRVNGEITDESSDTQFYGTKPGGAEWSCAFANFQMTCHWVRVKMPLLIYVIVGTVNCCSCLVIFGELRSLHHHRLCLSTVKYKQSYDTTYKQLVEIVM